MKTKNLIRIAQNKRSSFISPICALRPIHNPYFPPIVATPPIASLFFHALPPHSFTLFSRFFTLFHDLPHSYTLCRTPPPPPAPASISSIPGNPLHALVRDLNLEGRRFDDDWMITEFQGDGGGVGELFDWGDADGGVVEANERMGGFELDGDGVGAFEAFIPNDELKGAIAALEKEVVNGGGLVGDGVVERIGVGERAAVTEDGGEVMEVKSGRARGVVGTEESELLVAAFVDSIAQKVDGGIAPAALELVEIEGEEVERVDLLRDRAADGRASLGGDAREARKVVGGDAGEMFGPGASVLSVKPVDTAGGAGIGSVPGFVVFQPGGSGVVNVVVDVGVIGKTRAGREERVGPFWNGEELEAHIVSFRATLADGPDRIALKGWVCFDGGIEVAHEIGDGHPAPFTTTGLALVFNGPVVRLVRAFEGKQRIERLDLPGGVEKAGDIRASAAEAPAKAGAGFLMELKELLDGDVAFDPGADPPHAQVTDAVDGFGERFAASRNGGESADALQEIGGMNGGGACGIEGERDESHRQDGGAQETDGHGARLGDWNGTFNRLRADSLAAREQGESLTSHPYDFIGTNLGASFESQPQMTGIVLDIGLLLGRHSILLVGSHLGLIVYLAGIFRINGGFRLDAIDSTEKGAGEVKRVQVDDRLRQWIASIPLHRIVLRPEDDRVKFFLPFRFHGDYQGSYGFFVEKVFVDGGLGSDNAPGNSSQYRFGFSAANKCPRRVHAQDSEIGDSVHNLSMEDLAVNPFLVIQFYQGHPSGDISVAYIPLSDRIGLLGVFFDDRGFVKVCSQVLDLLFGIVAGRRSTWNRFASYGRDERQRRKDRSSNQMNSHRMTLLLRALKSSRSGFPQGRGMTSLLTVLHLPRTSSAREQFLKQALKDSAGKN